MTRPRPVIAIDGPAGVGKSTTSRELARLLLLCRRDGVRLRLVSGAAELLPTR